MPQDYSNEIISAEIVFSRQNDMAKIGLPDHEYREELNVINEKLEKYANHADRYDYMVAVASGILCGVLDAQVADVTKKILRSKELDVKGRLSDFVKDYTRQIEKDQRKTSMAEMAASVFHSCMNKNGTEVFMKDEETGRAEFDPSKAIEIFGGAAVAAILKWMAAERTTEEINESDFPDTVKKLLHLLNEHPKVREFLKNPKIPEIDPKSLNELGVPIFFIALVESELPNVNKTIRKAKKLPKNVIHRELTKLPKIGVDTKGLGNLGNQAVGVLANEFIVRGFYFIRHLMMEMDRCGDVDLVDWTKVIPFNNRTIVRMMSIASLAFTSADMSIAAVRAFVESGGNKVVCAAKYVANINVIGVGRAIVAVSKDVAMEWEEADLMRERRELMEKLSAEQVEAILAYRKKMEDIVEEYLAEDLQAFLTETDDIEEGMRLNDFDSVIRGNVTIQRVLGRKPQFTNQAEFDDLMDSMEAFVL